MLFPAEEGTVHRPWRYWIDLAEEQLDTSALMLKQIFKEFPQHFRVLVALAYSLRKWEFVDPNPFQMACGLCELYEREGGKCTTCPVVTSGHPQCGQPHSLYKKWDSAIEKEDREILAQKIFDELLKGYHREMDRVIVEASMTVEKKPNLEPLTRWQYDEQTALNRIEELIAAFNRYLKQGKIHMAPVELGEELLYRIDVVRALREEMRQR
jgi:hypothetical protein